MNTRKSVNTTYNAQAKIALIGLLLELPSFILLTVSTVVTVSPLVLVEFLDSLCYVLQVGLVFGISAKLKKDNRFKYNYGVERIESMTSFSCDILLCVGTICAIALSISDILDPEPQSNFLLYVVLLKIFDVAVDFFLYARQAAIYRNEDSAIIKTEYYGALKDIAFDFSSLALLGFCYLFRDSLLTSYFSSLSALVISGVFLIGRFGDIRRRIADLTDKTLAEEDQMIIITILNKYDEYYSTFRSVDSHRLDKTVYIDFLLDFKPDTTYAEITELEALLQNDIQQQLKNCKVSIVITQGNSRQSDSL